MTGVLVISHGSRLPETIKEIKVLCAAIKKQSRLAIVEYAFLELAPPDIAEGITICVRKGASKVIILLNFLNAGLHVNKDIPGIVHQSRRQHPKVKIVISGPIGQHKGIPKLFVDVIKKNK